MCYRPRLLILLLVVSSSTVSGREQIPPNPGIGSSPDQRQGCVDPQPQVSRHDRRSSASWLVAWRGVHVQDRSCRGADRLQPRPFTQQQGQNRRHRHPPRGRARSQDPGGPTVDALPEQCDLERCQDARAGFAGRCARRGHPVTIGADLDHLSRRVSRARLLVSGQYPLPRQDQGKGTGPRSDRWPRGRPPGLGVRAELEPLDRRPPRRMLGRARSWLRARPVDRLEPRWARDPVEGDGTGRRERVPSRR